MIEVIGYLGGVLVMAIFLFFIFCVLGFLFGLLQVWVVSNEIRGMSKKELKKAEQELCKHSNTVFSGRKWECCDCGKSV